jgi:hypothetical protein
METDFNKLSIDEIKALLWVNQDLKIDIADNMLIYGGSFVQALAQCILRADRGNLFKLVDVFSEYFVEYHPSKWKKKV